MNTEQKTEFLLKVERFLSETGMGPSYFGKQAAGNSELVARIRAGGRVWPETVSKVDDFIAKHSSNGGAR